MKRLLLVSLIFFFGPICFAQRLPFFGLFPQFSQTGPISKKLNYNLFVSSTITAVPTTIEGHQYPATALQVYVQPSLHYKLLPNVQVGLGYAYAKHDLFGLHVQENRAWAQLVAGHSVSGQTRLTHRLRYEERYPFRVSSQQWSYATLIRYHVGVNVPLYDLKAQKRGFFLSATNEAFFCLTGAKNGPISAKNAFYGEDWVSAGVGYNAGKWCKFDVSYQFQDLIRDPAKNHRHLHLLQLNWSTNLSLDGLGMWLMTPPY